MKAIFIAHIRPIIDFWSPVWNPGYITVIKDLELVQQRWTKHIDGVSNLTNYNRLKYLSLFSIWGRLLSYDLIPTWKFLNNTIFSLNNLLSLSNITHTHGHPFTPISKFKIAFFYEQNCSNLE